jgi:hypothetical protein
MVAACADAPIDSSSDYDALPNVENPDELGQYVTGSWSFDSIELALLDEAGNLLTEPTTLYANELGTVVFADGSGELELQFEGGMIWYEDGSMATWRKIWSSTGELDHESVIWGEWEPMAEKLQMDTDEFFARAFVTALSQDGMFLDWDDEDPFLDIYSSELTRVDESEFSWIVAD